MGSMPECLKHRTSGGQARNPSAAMAPGPNQRPSRGARRRAHKRRGPPGRGPRRSVKTEQAAHAPPPPPPPLRASPHLSRACAPPCYPSLPPARPPCLRPQPSRRGRGQPAYPPRRRRRRRSAAPRGARRLSPALIPGNPGPAPPGPARARQARPGPARPLARRRSPSQPHPSHDPPPPLTRLARHTSPCATPCRCRYPRPSTSCRLHLPPRRPRRPSLVAPARPGPARVSRFGSARPGGPAGGGRGDSQCRPSQEMGGEKARGRHSRVSRDECQRERAASGA